MKIFESSPESLNALHEAIIGGLKMFTPPPDLRVSEWSDEYGRLPRESSAQPGQWITATAEYQRGLMDAVNDPAIERIVAIWAAQTGKTANLLNVIGYFTHQDPSPILGLQPTLEMAEAFSKDRVAPMIRDTPVLQPLFGDPRGRDSGNTLLHKQFPGGFLALAGANSPASLASRPIRIVLCDEVDRYPASAGTEGDPVKLAIVRTTTFWNRKIILTSTPTIKGASRIEKEFLKSDQRYYFVKCPHCGEQQQLIFKRLMWPSPKNTPGLDRHKPDECYYVCQAGCEILESEKSGMIAAGEWLATAVSIDGKTAGFHLNALYSPWMTWPDLIRHWLDAQGDAEELKTFINTRLAETFELQGDRVEQDIFRDRQHAYPSYPEGEKNILMAPQEVLIVTAAVDVQDNRLEAQAVGWGMGEESWDLEHRVFEGNPAEIGVWRELSEWLMRTYRREDGVSLRIRCAMIDSGGHHTKQVYWFAQKHQKQRIYACVGRAGNRPVLSRPTTSNELGIPLYTVGVDTAKESFYSRLKIETEGPGYCHFPDEPWADAEYFAQLTAEQLITVRRDGVDTKKWVKRRPRNEALDLRVYAMAALERLKPNFEKWAEYLRKQAQEIRPEVKATEPVTVGSHAEQKQVEMPQVIQQKIASTRPTYQRPGGWVNAWR